jgi:ankyrin repeat protein
MPEIHAAAYMGDLESLQERLKTDDPNQRAMTGITPLISAVWKEQEQAYRMLIRHGADPNLCDDEGLDVLSHVMNRDMQHWLVFLLDTGSRPDPRRHRGLMVWVARYGPVAWMEKVLCASPAMIDDTDKERDKNNVFHTLIRYRYNPPDRDAAVEFLLKKGADPCALDTQGHTPLQVVRSVTSITNRHNDHLQALLQNAQNAVWLYSVARVLQDTRRPALFTAVPIVKNEVLEHVVCRMNPSLIQELSQML